MLEDKGDKSKGQLPVDQLTLDVTDNQYKLRIIFQSITATHGSDIDEGIDYNMFVLIAVPHE